MRSEDANISQDETLGDNNPSRAFILAPFYGLWWQFPHHIEPDRACFRAGSEFVLVYTVRSHIYFCACRGGIDLVNFPLP